MDDDSELIKDSVKDVEKWKNRRRLRKRDNKEDDENETMQVPSAPTKQKSVDKKPSSPPQAPLKSEPATPTKPESVVKKPSSPPKIPLNSESASPIKQKSVDKKPSSPPPHLKNVPAAPIKQESLDERSSSPPQATLKNEPVAPIKQKSVDKKPSSPPPVKQPIGKRMQQRVSDVPEEVSPAPPAKDTFIKGIISVQSKKDKSKLGAQKKTVTLRKSPGTSGFGFTLEECPDEPGLQIKDVDPESPAGVAELKKGELLLEINNADVKSMGLANTEKLIRDCLRMGHITMVLLSPSESKPVKVPGKLKAAAAQFDAIAQNGVETVKDSKTTVLSKQVENVEDKASPDNLLNKKVSKVKKSVEAAEKSTKDKSDSAWKEKKPLESPQKTESAPTVKPLNGQLNQSDKVEGDKSAAAVRRKEPQTSKVADAQAEKPSVAAEHRSDTKSSMPVEAFPKLKDVTEPISSPTDSASSEVNKSVTSPPIKGSRVQSLKSAYEGAISKETRDSPKPVFQRQSLDGTPTLGKTPPTYEGAISKETREPSKLTFQRPASDSTPTLGKTPPTYEGTTSKETREPSKPTFQRPALDSTPVLGKIPSAYERAISKETREPFKPAFQRPAMDGTPSLGKTEPSHEIAISKEAEEPSKPSFRRLALDGTPSFGKIQPKMENGTRNISIESVNPSTSGPPIGFSAIRQAVCESSPLVAPEAQRRSYQVPSVDPQLFESGAASNKSEVVISFHGQSREGAQTQPQRQSFPTSQQHPVFATLGAQQPTYATQEQPAPPYPTETTNVFQQPTSAFTATVQQQSFASVGNAIRHPGFSPGANVQQLAHQIGLRHSVADIPDINNRTGQIRPLDSTAIFPDQPNRQAETRLPLDNTASFASQPLIERNIPIELEKRPPGSDTDSHEVSSEEPCVACWKPLGRGTAVRIASLKIHFHMACFRCCECWRSLEMQNNGIDVEVRGNNKLYCDRCSKVYKAIRAGRR